MVVHKTGALAHAFCLIYALSIAAARKREGASRTLAATRVVCNDTIRYDTIRYDDECHPSGPTTGPSGRMTEKGSAWASPGTRMID